MGMNIKSQRAHELARRAAALTGTSQTGAVEHALEQYLRSLEQQQDAATVRVRDVIASLDARLTDRDREALRSAELYDDLGLPK